MLRLVRPHVPSIWLVKCMNTARMHVFVSLSESKSRFFYPQWFINPQKQVKISQKCQLKIDDCPANLYRESGVLIVILTGTLSRNTLVYSWLKKSIITIIITVSWIPFYSQSILCISIKSKRHTRVFVVLEECFDNRDYHCSSLHIYSSSQKHLFFLQFYLRWVGLLHLLLLQQFNGTVLENWRHGCIFFFRLIGNSFGGSFWQTSSSPSNINLTLLVLHVLRNPPCFLS